jgi:hypothetical protein
MAIRRSKNRETRERERECWSSHAASSSIAGPRILTSPVVQSPNTHTVQYVSLAFPLACVPVRFHVVGTEQRKHSLVRSDRAFDLCAGSKTIENEEPLESSRNGWLLCRGRALKNTDDRCYGCLARVLDERSLALARCIKRFSSREKKSVFSFYSSFIFFIFFSL